MTLHFQTRPNAFEIFGLDFLVDGDGKVWLLEVNAFPDFGQSGGEAEGRGVVRGLMESVVRVAVGGFFGVGVREGREGERERKGDGHEEGRESGLRKVLDIDLGRR